MKREKIFFAIVFVITTILALVVVRPFISYIVLAAILTYALFPVCKFIQRRIPHPGASSAVSTLIALLLMILPAFFVTTRLVQQVSGAYTSFRTESMQRFVDYLSRLTGNRFSVQQILDALLTQIRTAIVRTAPDILGSITDVAIGLFIMFFVMFYAFREGEGFLARIKQLLPLEPKLKENLFFEIRTVTQAVLYGQVMTAVIQGTLGGLGFLVFGVSNWMFWGTIMILLSFIPFVGTPLIWVPAAVGQILGGETVRGVGLLIYGATIVMNIDNVIRPRLVSSKTRVHPVLILIGVLGGLKIFGFIGMLVGPLILALMVALVRFYEEAYLQEKAPV